MREKVEKDFFGKIPCWRELRKKIGKNPVREMVEYGIDDKRNFDRTDTDCTF